MDTKEGVVNWAEALVLIVLMLCITVMVAGVFGGKK